jgi:hypothetical protein
MRYLIEVQPDAAADVWFPARMNRSTVIAVYEQLADADRVFKDALKCAPNYRLIETEESDAQLEMRRY